MLELRLRSGPVVAFDGRVVEIFGDGGSTRLHVARLDGLSVEEAPGGGLVLSFGGERPVSVRFEEGELPAQRRLVAALEAARTAEHRLSPLQPAH